MGSPHALGGYLPDLLMGKEEAPARFSSPTSDEDWMREALRASHVGCGRASPNPSVGCVLVKDGREIARGCTDWFGGVHGERAAVAGVPEGVEWSGVTAYVVLEPCAHQGKQPPCAALLAEKKPGRVVAALGDPFAAVDGRGFAMLREAGVRVDVGVLAREAALWLSPFLLHVRRQKVIFAGKWAQSLDGCLADDHGASRWITGSQSRRYTHWLRRKYDGILVGAGTLLADSPRLDSRFDDTGRHEQPVRFAFDPRARLLMADNATRDALRAGTLASGLPLVVISEAGAHTQARSSHADWHDELLEAGVRFETFPPSFPSAIGGLRAVLENVDFSELRPGPLRARPVRSVLVEGGPRLLTALMEAQELDLCHAFVAPVFLGGTRARLGIPSPLSSAERYVPLASFPAGDDLVWEFAPGDRAALLGFEAPMARTTPMA
jgi:diaminohydroxyphosphoribosylaminopyrimidine deaminase/5-amino-6-(5-phosphoribosylamino)uracil reductase